MQEGREGAVAGGPPTGGGGFGNREVLTIAKAQKAILWCILGNLVAYVVSAVFPPFALLVLGIAIYAVINVHRLATALRASAPILWCIAMFIPCISLICLLILSMKASAAIGAAGFRVGLMGADIGEIERRMRTPS